MWYVVLTSGIKRNRTRYTELRTEQTGQNKILAKLNTVHIYNQGHHSIFDVKNAVSNKLERIKHYKAAYYIIHTNFYPPYIIHTLHYFFQSPQTYAFVPAVICMTPPPAVREKVAGARYKVNEWIQYLWIWSYMYVYNEGSNCFWQPKFVLFHSKANTVLS